MKKSIALLSLVTALGALAFAGVAHAASVKNYFSQSTAAGDNALNLTGTWKVDSTSVTATGAELNEYAVSLLVADISAEATHYVVLPHAGTISKLYTVINGAVGTADVTFTCKIGSTAITDGVVTIATASSAAGDVDSASPSAANTITAGAAMNCVITGGGSGGTPAATLTVVVSR